jgi:hypothetical protein
MHKYEVEIPRSVRFLRFLNARAPLFFRMQPFSHTMSYLALGRFSGCVDEKSTDIYHGATFSLLLVKVQSKHWVCWQSWTHLFSKQNRFQKNPICKKRSVNIKMLIRKHHSYSARMCFVSHHMIVFCVDISSPIFFLQEALLTYKAF